MQTKLITELKKHDVILNLGIVNHVLITELGVDIQLKTTNIINIHRVFYPIKNTKVYVKNK